MANPAVANTKATCNAVANNQLALVAALLLEAIIRHFSWQSQSAIDFLFIVLQLVLESLPLLLAHYFAGRLTLLRRRWWAGAVWCAGFVLYPLAHFWLGSQLPVFAEWALFSVQGWSLLVLASAGFGLSRMLAKRNTTAGFQFFSRLLSLNSVSLLLLAAWAIVMAGIFASTNDPVRNQPLRAFIDTDTVIVNFESFLQYLWQFLLLGSCVLFICWLNRYFLIRRILAREGVFAYVAGCLISIIVLTPLLSSIVLLLPLNIPEFSFLPSQDYNIFDPVNYRFCFFVLAISTPVIMAFERQQQEKALAEIAQRHSQTELQLLQQQVNPHFLFNTLNNLYALTLTGSEQAPKLVLQLANLLRYTVYEGQSQQVSLAREIQYLQDFLALQAIRSGEKCQLHVEWPDNTEQWQIAPLLLIILLENAFKHGVEVSESRCTVNLKLNIINGRLLLCCANTMPEKPTSHKAGIGLENLQKRLNLLYAEKHRLTAEPRDGWWHAELSLELEPC
ncbi:sensor histidine kinase [Arsukibacterium sp.]|uniref:sensor histidine kinase n=1 Tax=Arsukibacterium sp. TaxID=1977258 RepID=UPI00299F2FA6|nr:histidine kinase [Arsukibacterium sp.]MDX1539156.1 histidine kinase [Arsukibacterium sp.]